MIRVSELRSPVSPIRFAVRDGRLCALSFGDVWDRIEARLLRRFGPELLQEVGGSGEVVERVGAYLDGEIEALREIPVDTGGTDFQQKVWSELRNIPAGTTWSYREVAGIIENPRAIRAVGSATGANPICIVIPCHRLIRSDGDLGGYAGGVERKRWLLEHEQKHLAG